jgi:phosphoenolpyruvate---glycerone phosphotransferase subunit DhaL
MDIATAKLFIRGARERMDQNREHLIDIDSVMGDGDLGLTMTKAFAAADDLSARYIDADVGSFFAQCGMAMAKAAPSTMGTLMGTGFMRGGKSVQGRNILGPEDVAIFFRAFAQGIADRGKCVPGEKTILDVMDPVATALEKAVTEQADLSSMATIARVAGEAGLEAAKAMMSQHGKAAIYREQTCGKPDPGATAGMFVIDAFCSVFA